MAELFPSDAQILDYLVVLVGSYLAGSIPFGLVLTRMAGLGDIRDIGSHSIGATNVLRTGNKFLAAATLILDSGKGAIAVLVTAAFAPSLTPYAAVASVIGHLFPVWLRFKGGKGVATTLGAILAMAWPVGIAACLSWLAVALILRYSSLSGMVSIGLTPVFGFFLAGLPTAAAAAIMAMFVIYRHSANIKRLLAGEEPRIGEK